MAFEIRPISSSEWLPDRCLRLSSAFDPKKSDPQAGCQRLQAFFTAGRRDRLVALYEDCLLRHGCCGFAAWDGPLVIGYNTFFPKDWSPTRRAPNPGQGQPGTLAHHCISIAKVAQAGEEAIATELLKRTFEWAKSNGWERFEVQGVFPTNPACKMVLDLYGRDFWEKLGLRVISESDPGRNFDVIKSVAMLDGVRIETEADADRYYPNWRRDAVHFTMAIDF
ncbi:hypothetical protein LLG95_10510 [bacterium]|nr:hypothetical protein [bacterium]